MNNKSMFVLFFFLGGNACAAEYLREKWFDYPDPSTLPRQTVRCVQMGSADVPCPTTQEPFRWCRKEGCTGHAYGTELRRVSPTFVVTGPDSADGAVRSAVTGIVAACGAKAIVGAKASGAATPSPEPAARVAAAIGTGVLQFKACVSTANATAVAAGILNQLEFKIESPTHWAPL